ncbi:MAG: hypothetical protein Q7J27_00275 [Syntrophales bacterium]|nr:hypothetical protein [Syntrophales bacterium]
MEELKNKFDALNKAEKIQFMKEVLPEFCKLFAENQQDMTQDMMPLCKELMKGFKMDMPQMMSMMKNKQK